VKTEMGSSSLLFPNLSFPIPTHTLFSLSNYQALIISSSRKREEEEGEERA